MYASRKGASNVDSFAALWAPKLVRFYYFICADKAVAEACAIETLLAAARSRRGLPELLRLAVEESDRLRPVTPNGDRMASALLGLPSRQRLALALSRGMGVSTESVAEAMSIKTVDAKRLLADALLGLHRALHETQDKPENASEI